MNPADATVLLVVIVGLLLSLVLEVRSNVALKRENIRLQKELDHHNRFIPHFQKMAQDYSTMQMTLESKERIEYIYGVKFKC